MSSAYQLMLPFIIINLGAEMVYILDQRLREQDLSADRCSKVLEDIIQNMFSQSVVKEIFRSQTMYSLKSTKQIFNKVAHSSNRKLDNTAMQTLFDLMVMGFKYQVKLTTQPEDIYFITKKHLETLKELVASGTTGKHFVLAIENKFEETFRGFTAYDYIIVRQQIYKFFEDKHLNISVFNRDGVQKTDASILLDLSGPGPQYSVKPGQVKFFNP